MIHPILDEYYVHNPYHCRSSKFAVEKGLVTNEKGATPQGVSRVSTPPPFSEDLKKHLLSSKIQDSFHLNLAPEVHRPLAVRTVPSESSLKSYSDNGNATHDFRRVTSLAARDPARPQEQGNTKRKRRSVVQADLLPQAEQEPEPGQPDTSQERLAYGDPAKIAQYFPELTL